MLRRLVQRSVRNVHAVLCRRHVLPAKLALYFHSVESRERLAESLAFLADQGYAFARSLDEFLGPGKMAFVSFDDNYGSWVEALGLLDRHRIQATFYVNSWPFRDRVSLSDVHHFMRRLSAREEMTLSTAELREVAAAGHVIGAHTRTHPVLTALPRAGAYEEIRAAKLELEDIVQRQVAHFSYPFGMRRHFNDDLRHYCLRIGYSTIANGIPGMQYATSRADSIHRSPWLLDRPLDDNLANIAIDGRVFQAITGRSAVGGRDQ